VVLHCWRVALGTDCVKTILGTGTRLFEFGPNWEFGLVGMDREGDGVSGMVELGYGCEAGMYLPT